MVPGLGVVMDDAGKLYTGWRTSNLVPVYSQYAVIPGLVGRVGIQRAVQDFPYPQRVLGSGAFSCLQLYRSVF